MVKIADEAAQNIVWIPNKFKYIYITYNGSLTL